MLRITLNSHAAGAKSYYATADYYTEGQELIGRWRGKGAARLGLRGDVERKEWDALCDNRNPMTGEVLTARQRRERRVGYDMNFHAPKSLSLLYGMTQDARVLETFREAVDATMQDMEVEMKTRIRMAGKNEDRTTGNMVWGEFVHTTARPVQGVPDPHLHAHCFVFNSTWDSTEKRWKAGQFADLKRDASYFEALFHSRLAQGMENLGLHVKRTKKSWELDGLSRSTLEKFSRRTAQIEREAQRMGITDAEKKDGLGAKTREKKLKEMSYRQLQENWRSRLDKDESDTLARVEAKIGTDAIPENLPAMGDAVLKAIDHCFERNSVVPERKVMTEALKRSLGLASPMTVESAVARQQLIFDVRDNRKLVTTRAVLEEERGMIEFARMNRGTCRRLGTASYKLKREWLNADQQRAVRHVADSMDRVILVRGAAGTGKTSMMQEAVEAIQVNGKRVFTFAPSADAGRGVLRKEGFQDADTVARLLVDREMQKSAKGQVLWIDEAGLLGTRQMAKIFDLAKEINARVILSGDTRQHGSVERGAALRLLEEEAGLFPTEIREIQRQKGQYKQAVKALSEGRTADGFKQLDRIGAIREVGETERYKMIADDYVAAVSAGKSAIVVSPTHLEGEWITDEIRSNLKQAGKLCDGEQELVVLENANMTESERADPVNLGSGDVLVFHQNAKGYAKGSRITLQGEAPVSEAARYQVFRQKVLPIAPGDAIRITRNGKSLDGRHGLDNGAIFTVRRFDTAGNIVLTNGWKVARDYGHLAHGYVVTSHASQGKTVDQIFIGQSAQSFAASSREQFYVSVSRGREGVTVYTDDKDALLDAVDRTDDRLSATELVTRRKSRERATTMSRLDSLVPAAFEPTAPVEPTREELVHER